MSGDKRPVSVRLHEKANRHAAFNPASAQDYHELADEVADLEAALSSCGAPIEEASGEVCMHGARGYVAPHFKVNASDGFKDGQIVTAYIFALPTEGGAP